MLGVRLDQATEKSLAQIARQTRRPKSDIAREVIVRFVRNHDEALRAEARRQSLAAAARGWSEEDAHWESMITTDDYEAAPKERTDD